MRVDPSKLPGFPKNKNGHDLGCPCAGCEESRRTGLAKLRARIHKDEEPKTFGEILEEELAKRRDL